MVIHGDNLLFLISNELLKFCTPVLMSNYTTNSNEQKRTKFYNSLIHDKSLTLVMLFCSYV